MKRTTKTPLSLQLSLTESPTIKANLSDVSKTEYLPQVTELKHGDRFIKIREVEKKTSRKKSQIYADPTFPKPIKLSVRESAWLESEILAWMQARLNAARTPS